MTDATIQRWRFRRPSLVWLVPIAASLIVAYLAVSSSLNRGIDVTVLFDTASGLQPGTTKVVYKGLDVGTLIDVRYDRETGRMATTLRMRPELKPVLRAHTQFWLVGAGDGLSLSSLQAVVSGVSIGLQPGDGAQTRRFVGLDTAPVVPVGTPGRNFRLTSSEISSARTGASVYYRGLKVGKVTSAKLVSAEVFQIGIFVAAPYDRLVSARTLFWSGVAVRVSFTGDGIATRLASPEELLSGGIEFNTPSDDVGGSPSPDGTAFTLFSDRNRARAGPPLPAFRYSLVVADPVGDLVPGAPVTLRNFYVGEVRNRTIVFDAMHGRLDTRVTIALEPQRLLPPGSPILDRAGSDALVAKLVATGYRARLVSAIPLIGGKGVSLTKVVGSSHATLGFDSTYPEVPTIPANDLTALTTSAGSILAKIDHMPLAEIGLNVRQLTARLSGLTGSPHLTSSIEHLDGSLASLDAMLAETRPKIGPIVDHLGKTAADLDAAAAAASALLGSGEAGEDAALPAAIRQLAETAATVRSLADYLDRHPEALVRGKTKERR